MKQCSKCGEIKSESEFYKDKRTIDGLKCQCKKCHIKGSMLTRNKERCRESNKRYMQRAVAKNPIKFREQWKKYNRPKDERVYARMLLNIAVRNGTIKKPDECQVCGRKLKLTAHHENYDEPLQVQWLCYECHAKLHRMSA